MKKVVVLGGGGFIGGHLAKRLKSEGNYVRVVDIKMHEYFTKEEMCDEFIIGDLNDPNDKYQQYRFEDKKVRYFIDDSGYMVARLNANYSYTGPK